MAELSRRFSIIESVEADGSVTRTTEYLEYGSNGKLYKERKGSFTLAEGETLETWFDEATDPEDEPESEDIED